MFHALIINVLQPLVLELIIYRVDNVCHARQVQENLPFMKVILVTLPLVHPVRQVIIQTPQDQDVKLVLQALIHHPRALLHARHVVLVTFHL